MSPRWMARAGRGVEGSVGGEGLLVHQEEVADAQGGHHGAGGDAEGLDDKRDDEGRNDDELKQDPHKVRTGRHAIVRGAAEVGRRVVSGVGARGSRVALGPVQVSSCSRASSAARC